MEPGSLGKKKMCCDAQHNTSGKGKILFLRLPAPQVCIVLGKIMKRIILLCHEAGNLCLRRVQRHIFLPLPSATMFSHCKCEGHLGLSGTTLCQAGNPAVAAVIGSTVLFLNMH